jgi:hypothetical protein
LPRGPTPPFSRSVRVSPVRGMTMGGLAWRR